VGGVTRGGKRKAPATQEPACVRGGNPEKDEKGQIPSLGGRGKLKQNVQPDKHSTDHKKERKKSRKRNKRLFCWGHQGNNTIQVRGGHGQKRLLGGPEKKRIMAPPMGVPPY